VIRTVRRAALVAALAAAAGDASADPIRISVANFNANFSPIIAAQDRGYFKDEGLEVEITHNPGGVATPALIAGSLQYSSSTSSALSAILKGAELKVVLVGTTRSLMELYTFDPTVTRFEDLKGRVLPVASRGGTDELATRLSMKKKGLPNDFVGFTAMGQQSIAYAAVVAGSQQFLFVTRGDKGRLQDILAKGRLLVSFQSEIETQSGGLVTTTKEVANNRDRATKILRALWKGTLYSVEQPEGMADILQKRMPNISRQQIETDIAGAKEDVNLTGIMSPEATARELVVRGEVVGQAANTIPSPERVYDFTLIQQVIAELKAAGWKPAR
jgi:ABC-type nitrate/sulfonate/bicarbonate transport system substrate-binding protein